MRREINVMKKEYFHVCADGADAPVIKSSMRLFISIMRLRPGKAVLSLCSVVNYIRLAMTLIICGMSPSIQSFNQQKTASP